MYWAHCDAKAKHGIEQLLSDSLKTMWLGNNAEGNGNEPWKVCVNIGLDEVEATERSNQMLHLKN